MAGNNPQNNKQPSLDIKNLDKISQKMRENIPLSEEDRQWIRKMRENDPVIQNAKRHKTEFSVQVKNKFEPLSNLSDTNMDTSEIQSAKEGLENTPNQIESVRPQPKLKIPPIVITEQVNYQAIIEEIKGHIKSIPKFQATRNGLKIFVTSVNDFEKLKGIFKQQNKQFYTHALKHERPIHQVIKGLPLIDDLNIIKNELADKGIKCTKVTLMKQREQINPIYLATFETGTDLNEVRKIQSIYHAKVKWEKFYNKSGVTQCHRCQQFGHGSITCNRSTKCVKCDQEHATSECQKPPNTEPYCVNCGPDSKVPPHRANSRKCPMYLQRVEMIKKQRAKKLPYKTDKFEYKPQQFPALPTRNAWNQPKATPSGISESRIPNAQQTINNNNFNQANDFYELLQEIDKLNKICNITKVLNIVKNLNAQLQNATTENEQALIILQNLYNGSSP